MGILFPKSTHKYIRETEGTRVKGRYFPGATIIKLLRADIQPVTGEEMEALQVGNRNQGMIKIYTDEELIISDEGKNIRGDRVVWNGDGEEYEVIAKGKRDNNIINHNKYFGELRKNDQK